MSAIVGSSDICIEKAAPMNEWPSIILEQAGTFPFISYFILTQHSFCFQLPRTSWLALSQKVKINIEISPNLECLESQHNSRQGMFHLYAENPSESSKSYSQHPNIKYRRIMPVTYSEVQMVLQAGKWTLPITGNFQSDCTDNVFTPCNGIRVVFSWIICRCLKRTPSV